MSVTPSPQQQPGSATPSPSSTAPRRVERSILLDAAPEQVWEAITDESLLRDWLAPEVEIDPREGGSLRCGYEDGSERLGRITLIEEGERMALAWSRGGEEESRVELILDPGAEHTRLTVIETATTPLGPAAAADWSVRLESLQRCLASLVYA